jgi:hypothetical protein
MINAIQFGATYAVKGRAENIEAHVDKLREMDIPVRKHTVAHFADGFVRGFIATGAQDVAEFDAKKATVQQPGPEVDISFKRQLKALLKSLNVNEFFAVIPKIQKKYEEAKTLNPSPEWTIYENQNLPFNDLEYFPISALNRALDKGRFNPETGIVSQDFDFYENSTPGEDGP